MFFYGEYGTKLVRNAFDVLKGFFFFQIIARLIASLLLKLIDWLNVWLVQEKISLGFFPQSRDCFFSPNVSDQEKKAFL